MNKPNLKRKNLVYQSQHPIGEWEKSIRILQYSCNIRLTIGIHIFLLFAASVNDVRLILHDQDSSRSPGLPASVCFLPLYVLNIIP